MSTDEKVSATRHLVVLHGYGSLFDSVMAICESPIERLFVARIMAKMWLVDATGFGARSAHRFASLHAVPCRASTLCATVGDTYAVLQAQVRDSNETFRLDVALITRHAKIAVELDGHSFHERTKDQARRDRSRERRLTLLGWKVVRFTGSEVYEDPEACVQQALAILRTSSALVPEASLSGDDEGDSGAI